MYFDYAQYKQKGQIFIFLLVGILILAVAGGAYYLGRQTTSKPSPTPVIVSQTPQPTSTSDASPVPTGTGETTNWKTYTATKFSIKYPEKAKVVGAGDAVSFTIWGPTQKADTEFYDALVLRFDVWPLNNRNLKQIVEDDSKKSKENGDILESPHPIAIADINGYSYKERGLGDNRYIYLPKESDEYLLIIDATSDPTNQGFHTLVDQMLSTFKFTSK